MRPTFSIIAFTVLSGAGYGVWFLLGLLLLLSGVAPDRMQDSAASVGFVRLALSNLLVGFLLVSAGLLSSLGHLGKPQRAWRALSQWRSSWLSREGIAALATYVPAVLLAVDWFFGIGFGHYARPVLGALLATGAALTVYCTSQIYASLKPVPAWHRPAVPLTYLGLALFSGLALQWLIVALSPQWPVQRFSSLALAVALIAQVAALAKSRYWREIDGISMPTPAHATGLDRLGAARVFEQPHTEANYLTHEMGFVLARKHAKKLRRMAWIAIGAVPGMVALIAFFTTLPPWPLALIAVLSGFLGLFVERWLFFAEARHMVMGFYGRRVS